MASHDFSQINSLDPNTLSGLRRLTKENSPEAAREAAKQFESMFMQQLLKTMRESAQSTGMLDNEATKLGSEMLDTQWAGKLSGQPGCLSDVIARQLERQAHILQGRHGRDQVEGLEQDADAVAAEQGKAVLVQPGEVDPVDHDPASARPLRIGQRAPAGGYRALVHQAVSWSPTAGNEYRAVVYDDRQRKVLLEPYPVWRMASDPKAIKPARAEVFHDCPPVSISRSKRLISSSSNDGRSAPRITETRQKRPSRLMTGPPIVSTRPRGRKNSL